jgi:hypothetical protein
MTDPMIIPYLIENALYLEEVAKYLIIIQQSHHPPNITHTLQMSLKLDLNPKLVVFRPVVLQNSMDVIIAPALWGQQGDRNY